MNILDAFEIIIKNLQLNRELIGAIVVIALFFVEFNKKIQFNPISIGLSWVGKTCTKELVHQIESLEHRMDESNIKYARKNELLMEKIEELDTKLDNHIQDSIEKDMRDRRLAILGYANSILNGKKHTKEQYIYMMKVCDKYEMDCTSKNIINSVAEESIKVIKTSYSTKLQENSFL